VALGAGIIWHQADPKRRMRWSQTVPQMPWLGSILDNDRRSYLLRFIGGLLFAAIALAGVGLALAPVLWRMYSQLRDERVGRIREQERAELAAMIHDQVLHTLA